MGFVFLSVLHALRCTSPPDCCWSGCCSVGRLCPNLCDLMDCSMPGLPVLHYLQEFCSNLCPLNWWCHPTTSSSVTPFSSCPQSFPASGSALHINHRKLTKMIKWTTALCNLMKLWAMSCRATQDGCVMVESSDKTWSTGEGNSKPLKHSSLENPMNSMKNTSHMWSINTTPSTISVWIYAHLSA